MHRYSLVAIITLALWLVLPSISFAQTTTDIQTVIINQPLVQSYPGITEANVTPLNPNTVVLGHDYFPVQGELTTGINVTSINVNENDVNSHQWVDQIGFYAGTLLVNTYNNTFQTSVTERISYIQLGIETLPISGIANNSYIGMLVYPNNPQFTLINASLPSDKTSETNSLAMKFLELAMTSAADVAAPGVGILLSSAFIVADSHSYGGSENGQSESTGYNYPTYQAFNLLNVSSTNPAQGYSMFAGTYFQWNIPTSILNKTTSPITLELFCKVYYNSAYPTYPYPPVNESTSFITIEPQSSDSSTGGSGGCVIWNTKVSTPAGYEGVQDIKAGQRVTSYDIHDYNFSNSTVTRIVSGYVNNVISINNGNLIVTPQSQPIWVRENGSGYFELKNPDTLRIGWYLYNPFSSTWIRVNGISTFYGHFLVYDLKLTSQKSFIANGFLVVDPIHCKI